MRTAFIICAVMLHGLQLLTLPKSMLLLTAILTGLERCSRSAARARLCLLQQACEAHSAGKLAELVPWAVGSLLVGTIMLYPASAFTFGGLLCINCAALDVSLVHASAAYMQTYVGSNHAGLHLAELTAAAAALMVFFCHNQ